MSIDRDYSYFWQQNGKIVNEEMWFIESISKRYILIYENVGKFDAYRRNCFVAIVVML